jgi:glycosyltransferase involved in cell wall biosynthesis
MFTERQSCSTDSNKIWVVIAAFNEAKIIGETLRPLVKSGYSVLVVDDCSTDNSFDLLSRMEGVVALRHPINLGQGAALQTGIEYAFENGASYIVTFDADGQHSSEDIPKLICALRDGPAEVALGSRFLKDASATNMSQGRRLFLHVAIFYSNLFSRIKLSDTHNGLRAFTRRAASYIKLTQNRMAHASEIISQIAASKLKYVEVPVNVTYTEYSKQKGQNVFNSFNIIWELITGGFKQ